MVITLDSESSDPGSSPGRTWWFYFDNEYFFTMRIPDNEQNNIQKEVLPGFEPGLLDSKSRVITITL